MLTVYHSSKFPGGLAYINRAEVDLAYPILVRPKAFSVLHTPRTHVCNLSIVSAIAYCLSMQR